MEKRISLAVLITLVSSATLAQLATVPASITKNETQAYVGLNWQLGSGMMPALVLGVVHTDVKSNGDTTGINLAFHLNLAGGVTPGKIKLSALQGQENLQAELEFGYNFLRSKPFIGLGLNAPYLAVGVDGYLNQGLVPYATIHSLGAFNKPNYSCAASYTLSGSSCVAPIASPPVVAPPVVAPPVVTGIF